MMTRNARARTAADRGDDVHVKRNESDTWQVTRGNHQPTVGSYRLKCHAVAFASAVAFGSRVEMIVHECDGRVSRHRRASLTYPTALD